MICSRLFSVSVLSFALARFHNMVANDEHFCRAEFTLLFIFRFVLIPVSAFLFSMYLPSFFTLLFTFTYIFPFFFPLLFLFLVLVPICSFEFSRFEPLLPGKQGQALLASKTNYIFRLNFCISESSYGDGPKPAENHFRALLLIFFLSEWSRILKRPW